MTKKVSLFRSAIERVLVERVDINFFLLSREVLVPLQYHDAFTRLKFRIPHGLSSDSA